MNTRSEISGGSISSRPEIHSKHFFFGYPYGAPEKNDMIIRSIYALSSNDETKFADWVCYRLDPITLGNPRASSRRWVANPWLAPEETLEPDDYRDAKRALNADRGYFAPLSSFRGSLDNDDVNMLSNISPQSSNLNQGPWARVEQEVRATVAGGQTLWVMTGPFYEDEMPALPRADEEHLVPSGYWKIVASGSRNDPSTATAVAFIFDQDTDRNADPSEHIRTVDEVEVRTGLDFFWELPEDIESQLESTVGSWPI